VDAGRGEALVRVGEVIAVCCGGAPLPTTAAGTVRNRTLVLSS
jgi:hypothetical protein